MNKYVATFCGNENGWLVSILYPCEIAGKNEAVFHARISAQEYCDKMNKEIGWLAA